MDREKILAAKRKYNAANRDKQKAYREANKEKIKAWKIANKENISEYNKKYRRDNSEKVKVMDSLWKKNNPDKVKVYNAKKYEKHKISILQKAYLRKKERLLSDPLFKLKETLRNRLRSIFKSKNLKKNKRSLEIFGESWEFIKNHLEKQFTPGMTWENHGEWEIDHIIPLSSGKTEKELIKLSHYSNLQPLWKKDNQLKANKH